MQSGRDSKDSTIVPILLRLTLIGLHSSNHRSIQLPYGQIIQQVLVEKQINILHERRGSTCLMNTLLRAFERIIE